MFITVFISGAKHVTPFFFLAQQVTSKDARDREHEYTQSGHFIRYTHLSQRHFTDCSLYVNGKGSPWIIWMMDYAQHKCDSVHGSTLIWQSKK